MYQYWLAMIVMILLIGRESIMDGEQSLIRQSPNSGQNKIWSRIPVRILDTQSDEQRCSSKGLQRSWHGELPIDNIASVLITYDRTHNA